MIDEINLHIQLVKSGFFLLILHTNIDTGNFWTIMRQKL